MTPDQHTAATDNALIEKLVSKGTIGSDMGPVEWLRNPDGPEAAERIKSLLAEVERLNALADEQARYANVKKDECSALKADRQRMREALERIRDNYEKREGGLLFVSEIARNALTPNPEPCPVCGGDCSSANPPVLFCPMKEALNPASKEANDG